MTDAPTPNPATSFIVSALGQVVTAVDKVRDTLERREKQSPGQFRITGGDAFTARSHRMRIVNWVLAVSNAGTFGLHVGSADVVQVEAVGAGTFVIPLSITIDRGVDVSTSGVAADITDSFVIAYTE